MKLKYIKETNCSECGEVATKESRNARPHSNGMTREERTFACGRVVSFSPNFQKMEVLAVCSNSLTVKKRDKKRASLHAKIVDMIEKSKVDEPYKERLLRDIRFS